MFSFIRVCDENFLDFLYLLAGLYGTIRLLSSNS